MADRFLTGAATAAHQVEGSNTHSDFWVMEHLKHSDFAEPSGMAVDHYNRYREDIKLLADANRARRPAADAPVTQMGYEDYPASVGNVVRKVAKEFKGELIVTENGIATADDGRTDASGCLVCA